MRPEAKPPGSALDRLRTLGAVSPHDLPARWLAEANAYERDGALVRGDALLQRVASELEAALAEWELEALTLERAARESGYSYGHVQRLVAEGKIDNIGTPGSPRVRRGDLPKKPGGRPLHGVRSGLADELLARREAAKD